MLEYEKTIMTKRLIINYDISSPSPREWDGNLGYFITCDSKIESPDKNDILEDIIKETGKVANNQAQHIELIEKSFNDIFKNEKIIAIYPITKYEHSAIVYKLGEYHGFDYSNNGFYVITKETVKKYGDVEGNFEDIINKELEVYNKWINGECYKFLLYDDKGNLVNECGGLYDIEDIRDYLPKEFDDEDLIEYFDN
jgi:hypothetical protein